MQIKQSEYDWVYLFAAVNPDNGDSVAMVAPTVNTELMNAHLRMISRQVGPDVQVVLVLDNAGWHVAKRLRVPQNITLLFLPAYAPELNPVERLWCYLKEHYLSNRVYGDYHALFQSACQSWNCLSPERIKSVCRAPWLERTN